MKELGVFDDEGEIDIKIIEEFERKVGFSFPLKYKSLISRHNALCPEENMFGYVYAGNKQLGDIKFFGYGNVNDSESVEHIQQEEYSYSGIIPFGCTANGDFICFDYRNNSADPEVVIMLHDVFDGNNKMVTCVIAPDFERFADSLESEED